MTVRFATAPTPHHAEEFAEAIGKIAALAAMSLHESFPHLDLDGLVETFTRPSAVEMIGSRYAAGLARDLSAGEAAAEAGTVLIRAWADARLAARAQLDDEQAASASPSVELAAAAL